MRKNIFKKVLATILVALVVYNSFYIQRLSEVKASAKKAFDPVSFARRYMDKSVLPIASQAPDIDSLIDLLKTNPAETFKTYGHALNIGNVRYFMVQGEAVITHTDESNIYISTTGKNAVKIAAEYVFGNALRDAPGIIAINDFVNITDLNDVSAEINKHVRSKVLKNLKGRVAKGERVYFAGAFELNQAHTSLAGIEIIPVRLTIKN